MQTIHMIQIVPVVKAINGWGNPLRHPVEIIKTQGERVVCFKITKPEVCIGTGDGYQLTLTRVSGSDVQWVLSAGPELAVTIVDEVKN